MEGVGFTVTEKIIGVPVEIPPKIPPQLLERNVTLPLSQQKESLHWLPYAVLHPSPKPKDKAFTPGIP